MKFHLEIDCDNAAFDEAPTNEVASLLRHVARRVELGDELTGFSMNLIDTNGNRVGRAWLDED